MSKLHLDTYRNINMPGLNRRRVDVWVPPAYEREPERRFPVLYMNDGQNIFEKSHYVGTGWKVHEAVSRLAEEQRITPPIVVGMVSTMNRVGEYLPQKPAADPRARELIETGTRDSGFNMEKLVSDTYLKWIVEKIKPLIDENYRTLPDRANTAIAGSSLGGLISLYALCEYPQVFGAAICMSTHWPILGQAMLDYCENKLPPAGTHKLYFDHGTDGLDALYAPWQVKMDALMLKKGYQKDKDWESWVFPDEDHNEIFWANRLHVPLSFLFGQTAY